jgi:hypothetical protein
MLALATRMSSLSRWARLRGMKPLREHCGCAMRWPRHRGRAVRQLDALVADAISQFVATGLLVPFVTG